MPDNLFYYGDNLDVLRKHVKDESVDLVYFDPPLGVAQAMIAFRTFLGENPGAPGLAYLANMAPRLVELRRVLKPTLACSAACGRWRSALELSND